MDFDLNWLQFLSNQEMQALLSENLFADALMEDSSLPALLGGSPNLFHQTSRLSGSEIFAVTEDSNANLAGDLQQCFAAGQNMAQSAGTSQCNSSLTGIEPPTGALPAFPSDPAFVERAAKYSSFVKENSEKDEESAGIVSNGNGNERGFTSAMSGNEEKYGRRKKRRNVDKAVNSEGPKRKRCKRAESEKNAVEDSKRNEEQSKSKYCTAKTEDGRNVKAPAPPDYIHVRARRGQATDSHSLAERARREKISERMKILQNLVPGCSKSTSKALMLDEIINHVQTLQRQVEYLSLKLATINPIVDFDMYRFSC